MYRSAAFAAMMILASCTPGGPNLPNRAASLADTGSLPAMRTFEPRAASRPLRSNGQIAEDFLDLAFQMESGRPIPHLSRFEGPIRVRVTGDAPATLGPDLDILLSRLRQEARISITRTERSGAQITIHALTRAEMRAAVPQAACFVVPRVSSWEEFQAQRRTATVDWTTLPRRERVAIFVPNDAPPQEIRDCLHEELAQAIGPLNDLYRLPDSVFNDDNIHSVLTGFDMLILATYYSPDLRSGMTRFEVARVLPRILSQLNPDGGPGLPQPNGITPEEWRMSIQTALGAGTTPFRRKTAASQAVNLARSYAWSGPRRGFALYVQGRLLISSSPDVARHAFNEAESVYRASALTQIHASHVAVQHASFALNSGDANTTLAIVEREIPVAYAHENAALLATLLMFKAEALDLQGRRQEAAEVRMDSLAWGRYGFGSEENVRARLAEVQRLNPRRGGRPVQ